MAAAGTTVASSLWRDFHHVASAPRAESRMTSERRSYSSPGALSLPERASTETGAGSYGQTVEIRANKANGNAFVLAWLRENYELSEGVCLPRCTLYEHYLDLCSKTVMTPVNSASFGKVIRQEFPTITTRRLGTRGQSKYHYYGLAIKPTSPYYDSVMKMKEQTVKSSTGLKQEIPEWDDDELPSLPTSAEVSSKSLSVAQRFPKLCEVFISDSLDAKKVETFLTMYTTHCQRFMDTILRASFNDINGYLLHFWGGMPDHLSSIIGNQVIIRLVQVCDTILYSALVDVLIGNPVVAIPESLTREIQTKLTMKLDDHICGAMKDQPQVMLECKLQEARRFICRLHERIQTARLAQGVSSIFKSTTAMETLRAEWKKMEKFDALHSTLFISPDDVSCNRTAQDRLAQEAVRAFQEFDQMLVSGQTTVETYADWLGGIVDRVMKIKRELNNMTIEEAAESVVLHCNIFLNQVMRDLVCLMSATFGLFDVLREFTLAYIEHLAGKHLTHDRLETLRRQLLEGVQYELPSSPTAIPASTTHLLLQPTASSELLSKPSTRMSPLQHALLSKATPPLSCPTQDLQRDSLFTSSPQWQSNSLTFQQSPTVTAASMPTWSPSWDQAATPTCTTCKVSNQTVDCYQKVPMYGGTNENPQVVATHLPHQVGGIADRYHLGVKITSPSQTQDFGIAHQPCQQMAGVTVKQHQSCNLTPTNQSHHQFFGPSDQHGQTMLGLHNLDLSYSRMSAFTASPEVYRQLPG